MYRKAFAMLAAFALAAFSPLEAMADEEIDYHYCTTPTSETVYGLTSLEITEAHAALSRRIHGEYRDAMQASLPEGHTIVDVEVSGSGIQGTPQTGYHVTLTWYYCVQIGSLPTPTPTPVPPIDP